MDPAHRPLVSYDPNPLLAWIYQRFFESIEVDEAWIRAVREADARGIAVPALAARLLEEAVARSGQTKLTEPQPSPAQIRAWLDSLTEFSDQIPHLPGETYSRATIYSDHD